MHRQFFANKLFAYFLTALFAAAVLFSPAAVFPAAAADAEALADDVLARNQRVIAALSAARAAGELTAEKALEIIQADLSPAINYPKITRRAMGKFWRKATDAQKAEVTAAFRKLLENTYANVLKKYQDQTVSKSEVKTLADGNISVVVEVGGASKPVYLDYVFSKSDSGEFLVTDVKVEKISLISNYRRQFKSMISAGGVDGLIAKLQEQTQ